MNRNILLWALIFFTLILTFGVLDPGNSLSEQLTYSEFLKQVETGQVGNVKIKGESISGNLNDGTGFVTTAPKDPGLIPTLREHQVDIEVPVDSPLKSFLGIALSWFMPALIFIALWMFAFRQLQGGGKGGAMGFGKSRARLLTEKNVKVTFDDVAGIEEAKDELEEIVAFLKNPGKFQQLGGKIPKGCLLVGSPGTGKTLLARAISGEANVPFFTISGSDFVEMFVGVGASRVRDMFEQGKKNAPCIVFIDEIDAVGRHRGAGLGGGNDEREQTLNQLLVEMDGFESNEGVIIIAATNRPDVLDPALLRPGRFDRQIVVPLPDIKGRTKIIEVHLRPIPIAPNVDAKVIARGTPGFSGADLANIVNEAALLAARHDKKVVTMADLEEAKDKVMMGRERKSLVMKEEERRLTAYHEAGHAIVGLHLKGSDPIHKATIIPRGRALGLVMRLPEDDRLSETREKLKADLAVAMGGRIAEELIFGYEKVTTGASSDIKQATKIAKAMVTQWGMSDKLGPLFHGNDNPEVFLGHSMGQENQALSDNTAELIDSEIKALVEEGYDKAKTILEKHKDQLHSLAKALLEYETLSGDEIKDLLAGKVIRTQDKVQENNKPKRTSSMPSSTKTATKDTEAKPHHSMPTTPQAKEDTTASDAKDAPDPDDPNLASVKGENDE